MAPSQQAQHPSEIRVGPGVVQDYQRQGPVHLARRLAQVLMSATIEATPQPSMRNEFGLLVAISHLPGLEQKKLSSVMALDPASVGQLIDELERKGWVRRVPSGSDRRVKHIEITRDGQRHVDNYRPGVIKAQAEVLKVLSAQERRTLVDLMARVIEANPDHDRPGAGRRAPQQKDE